MRRTKRSQYKVGDRQIRYDLKFLMAVLNFATMARDDLDVPLLEQNTLKGLPYPSDDNPQRPMLVEDRYLKMQAVANQVHPLCEAFLVVIHETGHRAASVRQLKWSDVDLDRGVVTWQAATDKIGFTHTTPLSAAAIEALGKLQRVQGSIGGRWVFPAVADAGRPLRRETAIRWWQEIEQLR